MSIASTFNEHAHASDGELSERIFHARVRMLFSHVPITMVNSGLFTLMVAWFIFSKTGSLALVPWLVLKLAVLVPRGIHALCYARTTNREARHWYVAFMAMLMLDGVVWGGLGWWVTPVNQMDLATVTLCCILGVTAAGAFNLSSDIPAAMGFVVPVLIPNAIYCTTRGDAYGWFGALALPVFLLILIAETRRSQRRIVELLQLRFESEDLAEARAQALIQAQHLSEAKSRFLATMSHEMRTPLHGILGLARLLRENDTPDQMPRRLELIERSGEHLLTVIGDVLDLSKIEAGRMELAHRSFDLTALIDEVADVSSVSAQRKQLALRVTHCLPTRLMVSGDAARVRQVLHNLLGNAIKFTEHGQIELHAWYDAVSGEAKMMVSDSGVGIPAHELPRIFDAFHQVDGSFERRHGGTGLGLTISRELCRAMGGDLDCTSEVGVGSNFICSLQLPRVGSLELATSNVPDSDAESEADAPTAGHVLLVEDNPVNALVAEAELQRLGMRVSVVVSGEEAIEWLGSQSADLVLMDCQMPGMDGFEATRRIRERERRDLLGPVPIVALTANVMPADRSRCLDAGMNDHLPKPFQRDQLERLLRRYLRRPAKARPLAVA